MILFGNSIICINFFQAIFVLNDNNYDNLSFKEEFQKLGQCKNINNIENITNNLLFAKNFLIKLKIYVNESEIKNPSKFFNIKTGNNLFILNHNNDKKGRPVEINKIFKGTAFE